MEGARVRGAIERGLLASLAKDAEVDAHVRQALDPAIIEEIESAGALTWLSFDEVLPMRVAHLELRSRAQVRQHYTRHFLEFTKSSIMQALASTLVSIFGVKGEQVHRVYPRIWAAFAKDAGEVVGELVGDGHSRVHIEQRPEIDHYDCYMLMHEAAITAMFEYADIPAAIDVVGEGRAAVVEIRWAHEG